MHEKSPPPVLRKEGFKITCSAILGDEKLLTYSENVGIGDVVKICEVCKTIAKECGNSGKSVAVFDDIGEVIIVLYAAGLFVKSFVVQKLFVVGHCVLPPFLCC